MPKIFWWFWGGFCFWLSPAFAEPRLLPPSASSHIVQTPVFPKGKIVVKQHDSSGQILREKEYTPPPASTPEPAPPPRRALPPALVLPSQTSAHSSAYSYLNQLRLLVGLLPFQESGLLAQAALNHAKYLAHNNAISHEEKPNQFGFTGETPLIRAQVVGYPAPFILENFSFSERSESPLQESTLQSIEGLMSAIYHRFGFLHFDADQVGVGVYEYNGQQVFVYNMANRRLEEFCRKAGITTDTRKKTCPLTQEALEEAFSQTRSEHPRWIVWPPENSNLAPPFFLRETPNPLPDRPYSGYPLSLQFNPAQVKQAEIKQFRLYRETPYAEITALRLLNAQSDPNRLFTPLEFAWFPLQVLDWNTNYKAEAQVTLDGQTRWITWRFRTKSLERRLYVIQADTKELRLIPGERYALFIDPELVRVTRYQWRAPSTMELNGTTLDFNTFALEAKGPLGSKASLTLQGQNEEVSLEIELSEGDQAQAP